MPTDTGSKASNKQDHLLQPLLEHRKNLVNFSIKQAFAKDSGRAAQFTVAAPHLLMDYSKNLLTQETLTLLIALLQQKNLTDKVHALITGQKINATENRSALHTALRSPSHGLAEHQSEINRANAKIDRFVRSVRDGEHIGFSGKKITDVVNIGIGGSDLGPMLATEALTPYASEDLHCHFVSNIDASHLSNILVKLNPETTLFIVASKSFTTLETLTNATTAQHWLMNAVTSEKASATKKHFVAISSAIDKVLQFGIDENNIFPMWEWVGGRYSLWSAIGLPIALAIGVENFENLKAGARAMDQHFIETPYEKNMPVILALLGYWYYQFWDARSLAVLPYSHDLRNLPSFLQQLEMESNGKSVDLEGNPIKYHTCPAIWGQAGTNGQHSFHQLLHQGTQFIPCDFILPLLSHYQSQGQQSQGQQYAEQKLEEHQKYLVANCLSQSEALAEGKSLLAAIYELKAQGLTDQEVSSLAPHKVIAGNRPSNTIIMEKLTPEALGALLALYEHKVFVQSVLWNVNPFDQWGVELGKQLSRRIVDVIDKKEIDQGQTPLDGSTAQLIKFYQAACEKQSS